MNNKKLHISNIYLINIYKNTLHWNKFNINIILLFIIIRDKIKWNLIFYLSTKLIIIWLNIDAKLSDYNNIYILLDII